MGLTYVDTSVAVAIAFREPGWERHTARIRRFGAEFHRPVSSTLLRVEVRRVFYRNSEAFDGADRCIRWVNLIDLDRETMTRAGRLEGHVRTLDAIHLAAALQLQEPGLQFWTLDLQQAHAATELGIATITV